MKAPSKIDLRQLYKTDYVTPKTPVLLRIKKATYLSITGQGTPGGPEFIAKIGALYAMAYTIKMTRKFAGRQDYTIGALEAQYWSEDGAACFAATPREKWHWKLLIRTPQFVKPAELKLAVAALLKKGKPSEVAQVKLESFTEGRCMQMLHVGPYDREGETIVMMQAFAERHGLAFHGLHHEIYLSDPRRVAPEKLKTILRHPVK